jgi:hypothetical protein
VGGLPHTPTLELPSPTLAGPVSLASPFPGAVAPNNRLHLHVYPSRAAAPRGVMVLCPFWLTPSPLLLASYVRQFQRAGFHTVLYVPPEHMQRTPAGYFSGERILGWDFPHMEHMLQLICTELREVTRAYRRQGHPVAMAGLSLGGLFASMAAVGGAELDALVLLTPAADMQVTLFQTRMGALYRRHLHQRGERPPTAALMTRLGAPYRPANFKAPLPGDRVFLAHGAHDAVVPWQVARDLADAWGSPLRTYAAGHMSLLFGQPALRKDLDAFLQGCLAPRQRPLPHQDGGLRPAQVAG